MIILTGKQTVRRVCQLNKEVDHEEHAHPQLKHHVTVSVEKIDLLENVSTEINTIRSVESTITSRFMMVMTRGV